jgi:hypothetical protein
MIDHCRQGEEVVKFGFFALGALAVTAFFASAANAQNYPWCANISMGDEAVNCGFDSFEQCMASLSGGAASGYCIQNNTYKPHRPGVPKAQWTSRSPAQAPGLSH